jgi:hypothetical protein
MADLRLMLLLATALVAAACDRQPNPTRSSITGKLPPARPAAPRPAFTFRAQQPPAKPIRA